MTKKPSSIDWMERTRAQLGTPEELEALAAGAINAGQGAPKVSVPKLGIGGLMKKSLESQSNIEATLETIPGRVLVPEWLLREEAEYQDSEFAELKESIAHTQINQQAIDVRRIQGNPDYDFELLAGTRRVRACEELGIKVFAIVRVCTDIEADVIHEIENQARKNKSVFSAAKRYAHLMKTGRYPDMKTLASKLRVHAGRLGDGIRLIDNAPKDLWVRVADKSALQWRQVKVLVDAFAKPKFATHFAGQQSVTLADVLARARSVNARANRNSDHARSLVDAKSGRVEVVKKGNAYQIKLPESVPKEKLDAIVQWIEQQLSPPT